MYCEICHRESESVETFYHNTGTRYCDGGQDVSYVARLECGHHVAVNEYSMGFDNPPDIRYYTLTEQECVSLDI